MSKMEFLEKERERTIFNYNKDNNILAIYFLSLTKGKNYNEIREAE